MNGANRRGDGDEDGLCVGVHAAVVAKVARLAVAPGKPALAVAAAVVEAHVVLQLLGRLQLAFHVLPQVQITISLVGAFVLDGVQGTFDKDLLAVALDGVLDALLEVCVDAEARDDILAGL